MSNDRIKGKAEELKGKIKGAAGDMLDDEQLQAEGRAEELKGHARHEAAEAKSPRRQRGVGG